MVVGFGGGGLGRYYSSGGGDVAASSRHQHVGDALDRGAVRAGGAAVTLHAGGTTGGGAGVQGSVGPGHQLPGGGGVRQQRPNEEYGGERLGATHHASYL